MHIHSEISLNTLQTMKGASWFTYQIWPHIHTEQARLFGFGKSYVLPCVCSQAQDVIELGQTRLQGSAWSSYSPHHALLLYKHKHVI